MGAILTSAFGAGDVDSPSPRQSFCRPRRRVLLHHFGFAVSVDTGIGLPAPNTPLALGAKDALAQVSNPWWGEGCVADESQTAGAMIALQTPKWTAHRSRDLLHTLFGEAVERGNRIELFASTVGGCYRKVPVRFPPRHAQDSLTRGRLGHDAKGQFSVVATADGALRPERAIGSERADMVAGAGIEPATSWL